MGKMTRGWWCWLWKLTGASLLGMGGTIAASGDCALAQIRPDGTLGAESSVVTPNVINGLPSDQINGGAVRGANLFHSFQEFNINEGRGAYFTNPAGIENILSRVTGGSRSDIFGKLGVLGNANLFLINPNGIIFGPNASLDVRGSFVATTANAVKLGETGIFSASEPATSNLLTVNPSALFFNAVAAQGIVNQSQVQSPSGETNSDDGPVGLQVQPGQTLALVGGDIVLEQGNLTAQGGRIELGSVAGVGEVSLNQTGNSWVLGYDKIDAFGDIQLQGGLLVDASGEGGGDIQIQGARLEMTQGANIWADTLGAGDGGEVFVRTTSAIALRDGSSITADVFDSGTGGNLRIETGQLIVRDGARVSAITYDEGAGGTLAVSASDSVQVIGTDLDGEFSGLFTGSYGKGNAGNLTITTGKLIVQSGTQVSVATDGQGRGGDLTVRASDSVEVIGTDSENFTQLVAEANEDGGDAGDITITTGKLIVRGEGARVSANTSGQGNGGNVTLETGQLIVQNGGRVEAVVNEGKGRGGNITVRASQVQVMGTDANGTYSGLFTGSFGEGGEGDAGNLTITTGKLIIQDGARVSAATDNRGRGGNLTVRASDSVEVIGTDSENLTQLVAEAEDRGDAGDINITTGKLIVRGEGARVSANTLGQGNGGNVTLETGQLIVQNGGRVEANVVEGKGRGGNITVRASQVQVMGTDVNGTYSGLFSGSFGEGDAGNLTITTEKLVVQSGARVSVATDDQGLGGNLTVTASDSVEVIGTSTNGERLSQLVAEAAGVGDAGDITITTGKLIVQSGAQVSASTLGQGKAGNIQVNASHSVNLSGVDLSGFSSGLSTSTFGEGKGGTITVDTSSFRVADGAVVNALTTAKGNGGNVTVNANTFEAVDGGQVLTTTRSRGKAGNITLNVPSSITLSGSDYEGAGSGLFANTALGSTGNGGSIELNTTNLSISDRARIGINSSGRGSAGSILSVNARDAVALDNGSISSQLGTSAVGQGGAISLQTGSLSLTNGAQLQASTAGRGSAGNVNIDVRDTVNLSEVNNEGFASGVFSNVEETATGINGEPIQGGNIDIQARSLSLNNGAQISASTSGKGRSGNIQLKVAESVNLSGVGAEGFSSGLLTNSEPEASGQGGEIAVATSTLNISDGAVLSARTSNAFSGGNITVDTNTLEATDGGQILTTALGSGNAGNITINASESVTFSGNDPTYTHRLEQFGLGIVNPDGPSSGLSARTQDAGAAGNLTITTGQLQVLDGAQVSAATLSMNADAGQGGALTIRTGQLLVENGTVSAETQGAGQAGNLSVNASEFVNLSGSGGLSARAIGTGAAGDLTITTLALTVQGGAEVTVSGQSGQAGNLTATSGSILLDQGELTAVTGAGSGGNITLQDLDLLRMHDDSLISAAALGTANGGNVNIDTDFIVAFPSDSDIIANAIGGNGGRVDITTQGIFGLEFREQRTPQSDITASSEFGVDGVVEINTPDVDPIQGLVALPAELVDASGLIASGCGAGGRQGESKFIVTGRGGLPIRPTDADLEPYPTGTVRSIPRRGGGVGEWESGREAFIQSIFMYIPPIPPSPPPLLEPSTNPTTTAPTKIVEATEWVINNKGEVILIASAPTVTPHIPRMSPAICHTP